MVMHKTRNLQKVLIAYCFVLMLSCVPEIHEGTQFVPNSLYDLEVNYSSDDQAFMFKLVSKSEKEICIPIMRWPNESGHYFYDDEKVYFVSNGINYKLKKDVTVHCTAQKKNGCLHILRKNDELLGKISIEDFVIPQEISIDKGFNPKFQFPYTPKYCAD